MKTKLKTLPHLERHHIEIINYNPIYIRDWKNTNSSRGVEVANSLSIKSVCLHNDKAIPIVFDGFGENALEEKKGHYCCQCECMLFPDNGSEHWILLIETKYAGDETLAFRKESNYPNCMVEQIIATVDYFRRKNIIENKQKIHAIVSFPMVESDFHDRINAVLQESNETLSIEEIKEQHNIIIRGCNEATIISEKRIKLEVVQ
ncbi:hypothetical protein EZS27_033377 [termite gut metagenome]|uniref:Uncharacterized protein n=1 Tax=termite gut metagenome TaxID=433724 RepID=A0A5J4Q6M7_9ZZZZ